MCKKPYGEILDEMDHQAKYQEATVGRKRMNEDLEAMDGLCAKIVEQRARIEALEAALEAMCLNMKNDGHTYRDCYIRARAALDKDASK